MWIFSSFLRFELILLTIKFHFHFFLSSFWRVSLGEAEKRVWINDSTTIFPWDFSISRAEFVEPRALHSKVGRTEIMKSRTRLLKHKARWKIERKSQRHEKYSGLTNTKLRFSMRFSRGARDKGWKAKSSKVNELRETRRFWMLKLGQIASWKLGTSRCYYGNQFQRFSRLSVKVFPSNISIIFTTLWIRDRNFMPFSRPSLAFWRPFYTFTSTQLYSL